MAIMNDNLLNIKYVFGLIAIVTGALATFDNSLMPLPRYLIIYISLVIIVTVLLHSLYVGVDNTESLEKRTEEF